MTKQRQYLSTREIAEMLGVHLRTVGNWIRAGELPAVRAGKNYRVLRKDLEAFLRRRKR